jgi:hypothetical protein
VELHRNVGDVLRLLACGRFHLYQVEASRVPIENIHRDECGALWETCLEDSWGITCDRLTRLTDSLLHSAVRQVNQNPAGKEGVDRI